MTYNSNLIGSADSTVADIAMNSAEIDTRDYSVEETSNNEIDFETSHHNGDSDGSSTINSCEQIFEENNDMTCDIQSTQGNSLDEIETLFDAAAKKAGEAVAADCDVEQKLAISDLKRSTALAHIYMLISADGGKAHVETKMKSKKINFASSFETGVVQLFFGVTEKLEAEKDEAPLSEEEKRKRQTHRVRVSKLSAALRWISDKFKEAPQGDRSIDSIKTAITGAGGIAKVIEIQQKSKGATSSSETEQLDAEILDRMFAHKVAIGSIALRQSRSPGALVMTACRISADGNSIELVDFVEDEPKRVTDILRNCSSVDDSGVDHVLRVFADVFRNGAVVDEAKPSEKKNDAIGNPVTAARQFVLRDCADDRQEFVICSNYTVNNPSMIATLKKRIQDHKHKPLKLNTKSRKRFEAEMDTPVKQYRYKSSIKNAENTSDNTESMCVEFVVGNKSAVKLKLDTYSTSSEWWIINEPDSWLETIQLSPVQLSQLDREIGTSLEKKEKRVNVQVGRGKLQVTVTKIGNGQSEVSAPSIVEIPDLGNRAAIPVHGNDFERAIGLAAKAKPGATLLISEKVLGLRYETDLASYLVLMPRLVGQGLDRDPSVGSAL